MSSAAGVETAVRAEDGRSGAALTERKRARTSSALGWYQPGLDGMRGIAMLWMLGYHGELPYTKGAFLALSQFFTLSGFLIMGVLLRNHLGPDRSLRPFWIRRCRRLMPAAFLALAGVVLFGATVATHDQAVALPGDVASAATWTANWHFVLVGKSYINLFAAPSPVQHFWSLAVEEQFYLVLPIVLLLVFRKTQRPAVIGTVLGALALASTAWMIILYQNGASLDRLYYGTDTRLAELLAGACLAVIISQTGIDWSELVRRILGGVGVLAFAATVWCWVNVPLADGPIWRGGFLVYALISCAVILGVLSRRGPLGPFLSLEPLPWIGRLSYGLYLFHWPVFLWLSPERTGLGEWSLLAVRLAVTFALAILSYRYVEQPILHGASLGLRGRPRLAIAPVVVIVIVVATIVTVDPSGEDPLAALRNSASAVTMPREAGDGVLDVLVIPSSARDPVMAQLRSDAARDASVKLTFAEPLRCLGGLVATPSGRTCASWARSWPRLVERTDPDAVLLYADGWPAQDVAALDAGTGQPPAAIALEALDAGIDMLTTRGASVVWAEPRVDAATAFRLTQEPLHQAMANLRVQRSDLFEVIGSRLPDPTTVPPKEYRSELAGVMLSDLSLYQRKTGSDLPRVMVVGDSQSLTLGYGLDIWARTHDRAVVWNHGVEGCGVAVEGEGRSFSSTSAFDTCRDAVRAWPAQVRAFRPDAVIVLSSLTDIADRRFEGDAGFVSFGSKKFDAELLAQYQRVVDTLSATGARVVWMRPPCVQQKTAPGQAPAYSNKDFERLDQVIIPRLLRSRPGRVVAYDLAGVVCPRGTPLAEVDGAALRPDGVHFSVDGSLWFANTHGDALLKAAGLSR